MIEKKDYVVKVHVYAESPQDASEKVARAMLGRNLTWQIEPNQTKTAAVDIWKSNAEIIAKFDNAIIQFCEKLIK